MRTKLVLMAMALPALFAACTSDEFVEPAQGDFNGRALLNGLTVNVDQSANTRFAWGDYQWKFEAGDQFGAALTDPTAGTVQNDQLLGNYIFSQAADGSYNTTSQMYEGIYSFYSYPDFQGKATRDLVKFDLGVQKADLTKPEEVISKTQLFFSPLYDIKAETVGTALPLKFYPYWSVAAFKIKNNTGAAFKISQIVLKGTAFATKGEIDATKIEGAGLVYAIAKGDNEYSLKDGMTDKEYAEAMATADIAKGTPASSTSIALNCDNYELANGKEIVAYMSVPAAATGNNVSVEIIVNVEGVSKAITVTNAGGGNAIASTGIDNLAFRRGQTKAVFGFETDGKTMKALNVAKTNLVDANGFYVDNKTDLLNVINANRGAISIYNMGDLAIDKDVANALNLYSAAGVTFANPIDVTVSGDATISKTTFAGGVTVKSGNVTFDASTVLSANKTMTVEGGKVILKDGTYNASGSSITVNGGELVVAKTDAEITAIVVNSGTLTLNGESQEIGTSKIAALTFGTEKATKLNVSLSGDGATKTLAVKTAVTLQAKTTTAVAAGNIVTIADGITLTNAGTIENNGEIKKVSATGSLTNSGSINNAFKIADVVNSGFIINTDEWYSSVTEAATSGSGYIDNTIGATVVVATTATPSTVYRVLEGTDPAVLDKDELMVFKNVTFTKNITNSNTQNVLFLGTTDIKAAVKFDYSSGVNVQIGLESESDTYRILAEKVLGKDLSASAKVTKYNEGVATRVYEGASLEGNETASTLKNYGGTSLNRGAVKFKTTTSAGTWTPNAVTTLP